MQYPHSIKITRKAEYEPDSGGNLKPVAGELVDFTSDCRAEIAGSNPTISGADGNSTEYSWIIYMPKTSEAFEFGDEVEINRDGQIFNSSLIQQSTGQFNTRLWV